MTTPTATADRRDLSRFLARVMQRGMIGPADAAALRERLGEATPNLPLEPDETYRLTDEQLHLAALQLMTLLHARRQPRKSLEEYREQLAAMQLRQLLDLSEKAQTEFTRRTHRLAKLLFGFAAIRAVSRWQQVMRDNIAAHATQQALLGSGGHIQDVDRVEQLVSRELGYLQRFADAIALKDLQGEPLTADYISARASLYAGAGRGEFYRQRESTTESTAPYGGEGYAPQQPGVVAEYISRDDPDVCPACHEAQHDPESRGGVHVDGRGYYLPGQGPFPGEVCWGKAHCRCVRTLRYLPDVYAMLTR